MANYLSPRTYYAILGVSTNATREVIRHAYFTLAKQCHPDLKRTVDPSPEKSALQFIEINQAYSVLRDSERRREYDRIIASGGSDFDKRASKTGVHHFNLGMKSLRDGMVEEAIASFERSLQADPTNVKCRTSLGVAYLKKGDLVKAETALKEATSLAPKDPTPFYHLGVAYKQMGLRAKAQEAFAEAVYVDPDYGPAAEELERIIPDDSEMPSSILENLKPKRILGRVFKHH